MGVEVSGDNRVGQSCHVFKAVCGGIVLCLSVSRVWWNVNVCDVYAFVLFEVYFGELYFCVGRVYVLWYGYACESDVVFNVCE